MKYFSLAFDFSTILFQLGISVARGRFLWYERQRSAKKVFIRRSFWISSRDLSALHSSFPLKIPNAPSVLGENFDLPRNERFFHTEEWSHIILYPLFFHSLLSKISNEQYICICIHIDHRSCFPPRSSTKEDILQITKLAKLMDIE